MSITITNQPQVTNADGSVSLPFSATDGKYTFTDAIVGSADFINGLTPDQLLAMQTQRWNNWYAIITNPNPAPVIDTTDTTADT